LTVIFGCDLKNNGDLKGSMNLEGTWKVTYVDEPSCKRCPADWPERKFLDYQLNIGDVFDFSKDQLTYKPIT